jgi:hypothetical protein
MNKNVFNRLMGLNFDYNSTFFLNFINMNLEYVGPQIIASHKDADYTRDAII